MLLSPKLTSRKYRHRTFQLFFNFKISVATDSALISAVVNSPAPITKRQLRTMKLLNNSFWSSPHCRPIRETSKTQWTICSLFLLKMALYKVYSGPMTFDLILSRYLLNIVSVLSIHTPSRPHSAALSTVHWNSISSFSEIHVKRRPVIGLRVVCSYGSAIVVLLQ